MQLSQEQETYWRAILADNMYEEGDVDLPEPREWCAVYLDVSETNGAFVQTFDTEEELASYFSKGAVYDETSTRDEPHTDWELFQIHNLVEMQSYAFRYTLEIGSKINEQQS